MRRKIYWIATTFVVCIMTVSGVLAITHAGPMMRALAHLGYPVYFLNLLGIGKLIGVGVILAPGLPIMKEWAYSAFTITVVGASYSHLSAGDGFMALDPLVTLAALIISYKLRSSDQRLESVNWLAKKQGLRVPHAEEAMPVQR
jgi:hypothetical protein